MISVISNSRIGKTKEPVLGRRDPIGGERRKGEVMEMNIIKVHYIMHENSIMKPTKSCKCLEISQWNPFVQLIHANKNFKSGHQRFRVTESTRQVFRIDKQCSIIL
jgi:hypothetical protein